MINAMMIRPIKKGLRYYRGFFLMVKAVFQWKGLKVEH